MAVSVLIAVAACAPDGREEESARVGSVRAAQFFEQAVRRDPTAAERSRVATLFGCSAFFLENTSESTFVATALHCVKNDIEAWCAKDGWFRAGDGKTDGHYDEDGDGKDDPFAYGEHDPNDGWCSRIIAADLTTDIAVFEADLPHAPDGDGTFRLAAYAPEPSTRLVMTGFPGDRDPATGRKGAITTTENCWTLGDLVPEPHRGTTILINSYILHNCSTYGGNSGGPMAIEGTRDAIGMPATYHPADYARLSATSPATAARLSPMSAFVALHRAELASAGIVIAETQDPGTIAPAPVLPRNIVTAAPAPPPIAAPTPAPVPAATAPVAEESGCSASRGSTRSTTSPAGLLLLGLAALVRRRVSPRASR